MSSINGPVVVVRKQDIKDLGNPTEAERLIKHLEQVPFSDALVLDLRGCYIDYPATPMVIDSVFERFQRHGGQKRLTLVLRPIIRNLDSLSGIFAKESRILSAFDKPMGADKKQSSRKLLADYCTKNNIIFEIYVIDPKDADLDLPDVFERRGADIFLNANQ